MNTAIRTSLARLAGVVGADRNTSLNGTLWRSSYAWRYSRRCSSAWLRRSQQGARRQRADRSRSLEDRAWTAGRSGQTPASFASASSPMIVQDFEWDSGAKLLDYQLVDDGKAYDANLRVQVKLTLAGSDTKAAPVTKKTEKTVWYLVGTSPKVTVFRDMLRK